MVSPAWAAWRGRFSNRRHPRAAGDSRPGAWLRAGFRGDRPGYATWLTATRPEGGAQMGDKLRGKIDQATGKAKETAGKHSDDKSLENEGRREQAEGDLREAAGKVKDAVDR